MDQSTDGINKKLVRLLDYVEEVVRLDERVAMRLSEYRLPDKTAFAVFEADTRNLPGIRHDVRDDEGNVWLSVDRLTRHGPPAAPEEIKDWIAVSDDPQHGPEIISERLVTVTKFERDKAVSAGTVLVEDILEVLRKADEPADAPPMFDLRLRLADRPEVQSKIEAWIAGPWIEWSSKEAPRRRTIGLYQRFYKILQLLETAGSDKSIELVWGIGVVNWAKGTHHVDRPLIERRVDIEIDDIRGGVIRVRPTASDATVDLKPYEEFGCDGLPLLSDLVRAEIRRAGEDDGVSPFVRESFEPILTAAASRLDPEGTYAPDSQAPTAVTGDRTGLVVSDKWVIFARPRSQHIVLQDIDRLRRATREATEPVEGVASRLVTHPSSQIDGGRAWAPIGSVLGADLPDLTTEEDASYTDVFFPKPFNDDQIEIVKRLARSDGLVVQGPPGTGKTHTIANLICHAMATGQRVLVVSRGEAALAVLREQLPEEVRPLAISILSSERQGLRQVEGAIRQVQEVVEATQPESRVKGIRRRESEILDLRRRSEAIDGELDDIAVAHLAKFGPRKETPAELAVRVASDRDAYLWFVDRPSSFVQDVGLAESDIESLARARMKSGPLLDHLDATLPAPSDLPGIDEVVGWHSDLIRAEQMRQAANSGPVRTVSVTSATCDVADNLANTLERLAQLNEAMLRAPWLDSFVTSRVRGEEEPWDRVLLDRLAEWSSIDEERSALASHAVNFQVDLLDDEDARAAIARAAVGKRLWPMITIGKSASKSLVEGITVDGVSPDEGQQAGWKEVLKRLAHLDRRREALARWNAFAGEVGAPAGERAQQAILLARKSLIIAGAGRAVETDLNRIARGAPSLESLLRDPSATRLLAEQIRAATAATRLVAVRSNVDWILGLFKGGSDRTSVLARQLFEDVIGRSNVPADKIGSIWRSLLARLGALKGLSEAFIAISAVTSQIEKAGAPSWAKRLRSEAVDIGTDPVIPSSWRDAWDHAAADGHLRRIDRRSRLLELAQKRGEAEVTSRRLFGELVRERTYYALERRLSPAVKGALVEFVRALARIGKGTGKGAGANRRSAQDAMARCYDAIPCWIMPTWRVAEQLPSQLGSFDLVILDEASQSDVTELPVLLRGKKILIVGDDRQVSPTAPFVTQTKIQQLRHHHLKDLPFKDLLAPAESIYDLMRAVYPEQRLMLKEHFRCVEPIIRFSMQFYPEKMVPLRIPSAVERMEPPLVDIYIPHGRRDGRKKINSAEAEVIVKEIAAIAADPSMTNRTLGVISLIGSEQAEYIRSLLSERVGEELMQRHAILCGDSATFQGNERDIVFLSMVADPVRRTALTMLRYEQRFNVAASRARDRLVLVRSVRREDLKPEDLKARLIAHFENPMPGLIVSDDVFTLCESGFERDMMRWLVEKGYRVQPQVGALGFRIDLVVEGANGNRLAVECDGDRFHGPAQWRDDMRRQRVLERVGWRFWRCFASNFYRDRDGVLGELVDTLSRIGIEPGGHDSNGTQANRYSEHRVIREEAPGEGIKEDTLSSDADVERPSNRTGVTIGSRVVLLFADDKRRLAVRLTDGKNDPDGGFLSINSALGKAVVGADEGEEVELSLDDGRTRIVLIELVEQPGGTLVAAADEPQMETIA